MDYTIQTGDSLSAIAKKYNTTIPTLMGSNKQITNPNLIMAGSKITVPDAQPAAVSSPTVSSVNTAINNTQSQPQGVGIRDYLTSQGHDVNWTAADGVTVDNKKIDTTGWSNIGGKIYATTSQIQEALNKAGVPATQKVFVDTKQPTGEIPAYAAPVSTTAPVAQPASVTTEKTTAPAPATAITNLFKQDTVTPKATTTAAAPVQASPFAAAKVAPTSLRTSMQKNYDVGWDATTGTVLIDGVPIDTTGLTRDANGSYLATPEQIANIEKNFVGLRETLEKAGYKNVFQDSTTGVVTADGKVIDTSALKLSTKRNGEKRWVGTQADIEAALGTVNVNPVISDAQKVQDAVVGSATDTDVLSSDKLNQIYAAITALMPKQKEVAPAITYQEGLTQAGEQLNPVYDQQMTELNKNITNRDAISGWLGQVPAEVMRRSSQVQENQNRTSAISSLANQLVSQSQSNANTQESLSQSKTAQNMDWIKTALTTLTTKQQNQFLNALAAGNFLTDQETKNLANESTRISNASATETLKSLPTQIDQTLSLNSKKLLGQDIANKMDELKLDTYAETSKLDIAKLKTELDAGEITNAMNRISLSALPEKVKLELAGVALENQQKTASIENTKASTANIKQTTALNKEKTASAAKFDTNTSGNIKTYGDYIEKTFYHDAYKTVTETLAGETTSKQVKSGGITRDESDTQALGDYLVDLAKNGTNPDVVKELMRIYGMSDDPTINDYLTTMEANAKAFIPVKKGIAAVTEGVSGVTGN